MNNAEVLIKFTGNTKSVDKSTKNVSKSLNNLRSSFSKLTSSFAVGSLISKGVSTAIGTISSSLDSAIDRIDTMNNFSKVMKNLGISTADSEKTIKNLSNKLKGLPTTLNSAASSVQRLVSYNGDINKSEQYFLALNNAIIAGTNDASMQASAIEQLTQAYTKGKPDMQDWKTLLQAMPAQLKQVAIAMGYVQTDQLYEALKNGEVSMNDFMDTLVMLNEKGTGEFASLEEQARANTEGIKTSIVNMKTAVARGVGSLITSIDKALSKTPLKGIDNIISEMGKKFETGLTNLGTFLEPLISGLLNGTMPVSEAVSILLGKITEIINNLIAKLPEFINTFLNAIVQSIPTMISSISSIIKQIASILPTLIPIIVKAILDAILSILDNIDQLVDAGIQLMMGLVDGFLNALPVLIDKMPDLIEKLVMAIANNLPKIIEAGIMIPIKLGVGLIKAIPQLIAKLPQILAALIKGIKTWFVNMVKMGGDLIKKLGTGIKNAFGGIFNAGKNVIKNLWNGIKNALSNFWENIKKIPSKFLEIIKKIPEKIVNVGKNIVQGLWQGIKNAKDWILEKISGFVNGVIDGIKNFFGIKSPSRVMRDQIGQWLPKGIAVGITANADSVYSAMRNLEDEMEENFGLSTNVANSTALNLSPQIVNNNYVSVETDPLGQVVSKVKTFSGGAKNDYNYGLGV